MNDTPCRVTYDLGQYEAGEKVRTKSERDRMIEDKADELFANWMDDEMPEEFMEKASDAILDLIYELRAEEVTKAEAGEALLLIMRDTLDDLAIEKAEEWELGQ
jgi:hypothetical protein